MMQSNIPQQISYNRIRMRGFYTKFTQWPVYPNSSNQYWNNDQIVRFQIDLKQKGTVVDPYRSHIQFTVSVNQQMYPIGGCQIDNSAQSFISQTVLSSNALQIQRIAQYDTLAAILTDLGFSQYVCQNRSGQGLGYTNIPTHSPYSNLTSTNNTMSYQLPKPGQAPVLQVWNQNMTGGLVLPFNVGTGINGVGYAYKNQLTSYWDHWGTTATHVTSLNPIWNLADLYKLQQRTNGLNPISVFDSVGRLNCMRAQYLQGMHSKTYPDSINTLLPFNPRVLNQQYSLGNMSTKGYNKNLPYNIDYGEVITTKNQINGVQGLHNIPTNCGTMGFANPVCSQYAKGTLQPFLSPTVPQVGMQNGLFLPQRVPLKQKTFRLPLISAILGVLIPPDQFTLIPLQALNNLILQITLSRYGMFTSGYSDCHQIDQIGMQYPLRRQWLLSNFAWNLHLYSFNQPNVVQMIQQSMVKSIALTNYGYALSSSYQITSGANVKGQYTIAAQYQSLCQIYCVFLSNQYQIYPFCRKQFRLSNNVTQLQFRINTDFYPIQPIMGNAGNPQTLDTTGDNWSFYQQIMLSNNFLFNTNHPMPKINTKNFAVNSRPYNVKNQKTLYDPNMINNPAYVIKPQSFNFSTAMGMSRFHENRVRGTAIYCYSWQPYGHSKQYLNGLNTTGTRNFQVMFNTLPINTYPGDQTLLIFSKYNQVTVYSKDGIVVYGK